MESVVSRRRSDLSLTSTSTNSSGLPQLYPDPEYGTDTPESKVSDAQGSTTGEKIRRRREFKARHIQMMGLGAAIGTGLFYQSGKVLYFAGPIPACLAYILMGTVVYAVLISYGEMVSFLPLPGGFFALANRNLSPVLGFGFGWIYWFTAVVGFPAKLVAVSSLMRFWVSTHHVSPAIWISVYAILPIAFNMFNVRRYGEIEFWLTTLKVATCVGLIILGLLLAMGASNETRLSGTNSNDALIICNDPSIDNCVGPPGFNYWKHDGWKDFLVGGIGGRLAAFWCCCCQACLAYLGTEIIGITAVEAERPRQTIPKAVRRVSKRVFIYYVGAIFVLGLNVSSNDPILASYVTNTQGSYQGPFVLMIQRANIAGLDHVLNAVSIVASLSVANANLYVSSRTLYALAREGHGPAIFKKMNAYDVPWLALVISALPAALAYMSVKVTENNVFDFLTGMSVTGGLIAWAAICATYLRFRKAYRFQDLQREIVPEAMSPLQPALAWDNPYWAKVSTSWGFNLGPYFLITLFLMLVFTWLVRTRWREGSWTWQVTPLNRIDLAIGAAPKSVPQESNTLIWRGLLGRFLEAL